MTLIPQYRIKPSPKPLPPMPLVFPILGALSGGVVAIWISMLLGPHWIELALPVSGMAFGAVFVGIKS
jgi:hypothetical protein